ncbi:hypothetical protein ACWC2T_28130 [Streptomyces sp. NPDC001393]
MAAAFASSTGIGARTVIAIDDSELPAEHPVSNQLGATCLSP